MTNLFNNRRQQPFAAPLAGSNFRELPDADLRLVSGGADPNYKFCWDGPAGAGVYPLYIKCYDGMTNFDLLESWGVPTPRTQ